jgi:site-specific DNA-methyltransferase (adenine-specific)
MKTMIDLRCGDCLKILPTLGQVDAVVSDPPYGMKWNTNTNRFTGGQSIYRYRKIHPTDDVIGDDKPFDPSPWIPFRKVVLFGANHYASRLPKGTTLVWLKKADHLFGTFLSDAEIGWMKGGHGVYCFRKQFPPPSRIKEGGGRCAHPTQKPVDLMRWCIERLKLKPGATILDPYMGSGTTGVAAVSLGFNFIGIELDRGYYNIARRRIKAAMKPTEAVA